MRTFALRSTGARVLVVGCEPASLDYGMGLSEPVAKAVDTALLLVKDLIAEGAAHVPRHTG